MPDRQNRPLVAGPDGGPSSPFPIKLSGPVIKGFGRGSREVSFSFLYLLFLSMKNTVNIVYMYLFISYVCVVLIRNTARHPNSQHPRRRIKRVSRS